MGDLPYSLWCFVRPSGAFPSRQPHSRFVAVSPGRPFPRHPPTKHRRQVPHPAYGVISAQAEE